jgi:membrane-associated protein
MNNLVAIIIGAGYVAIFITIFAESGFLLGFFLPGESLLFTLGIAASQGYFKIRILIPLAIVAAILGDSLGYWTGNYFGPKLFEREDSLIFKKHYIIRTQEFYEKYGPKTIIMARFVPIVRTFAPILAGVGKMQYKTFIRNNIIGGIGWAGGVLALSYYVGTKIPSVQKHLTIIILAIIFVSLLPVFVELFLHRKQKS